MNNFEEKLASSRIEDKDGSIDRFCGKISFKSFMDGDSVDVSIVNKPDNLICEQICVILSVEVGLSGFR